MEKTLELDPRGSIFYQSYNKNHMEYFMKYIELDQEMEKTVHTICDAALKAGGMQVIALVNQLVASIQDDGNQ